MTILWPFHRDCRSTRSTKTHPFQVHWCGHCEHSTCLKSLGNHLGTCRKVVSFCHEIHSQESIHYPSLQAMSLHRSEVATDFTVSWRYLDRTDKHCGYDNRRRYCCLCLSTRKYPGTFHARRSGCFMPHVSRKQEDHLIDLSLCLQRIEATFQVQIVMLWSLLCCL